MRLCVRPARLPLFAAACSLLLASALTAQTPTLTAAPDTANPNGQVTRAAQPGGVAISPDGATVAWTLRGRDGAALHLTEVANPANDKLIKLEGAAHCAVDNPVWSPDRRHAGLPLHLHERQIQARPGSDLPLVQSVRRDQAAHPPHRRARAARLVARRQVHRVPLRRERHPPRRRTRRHAAWNGVIGEDGVEIQRVYAVDVADGAGHWLTPDQPACLRIRLGTELEGDRLIAANPPGENTWWIAKLYAQSIAGGDPRVILDPVTVAGPLHGLQIAVPRWSPDGKHIAFIGGLMSDQGSTGGDI